MTDRHADLILASARLQQNDLARLTERFGPASEIAAQPAAKLEAAGLSSAKIGAITEFDSGLIETTSEWLAAEGHALLRIGDEDYPTMLARIDDAPAYLFVNGDIGALHLPTLAIVGSRNPTPGGERNAFDFAAHLASSGFCIASGLAQGIDAAAHRGAIEAGGKTLAFLGHGIDRVYPAANRDLAHRISRSGALVSEFPLATPPDRSHFPLRNRLISGSSLGTLVIEAARRSGSLITARLSGEQGREVFALPGSIHNPMARGCHQLIRSGAKLVESADDIVGELSHWIEQLKSLEPTASGKPDGDLASDEDQLRLLNIMGHDPISVDQLAGESGLTIGELSSMLLILELEGKVEKLSGGQYAAVH